MIPMTRMLRTARLLAVAAAATAAVGLVPVSAHGQYIEIAEGDGPVQSFGPGRMTNLLRPDYISRDAATLNEALGLEDSQQYILNVLLEDYAKSFEAASEELRSALRLFMPAMPAFAHGAPMGVGDDHIPAMPAEMMDRLREHMQEGNAVFISDEGGGAVEVHALRIDGDGPVTIGGPAGGEQVDAGGGDGEGGDGDGDEGEPVQAFAVAITMEIDEEALGAGGDGEGEAPGGNIGITLDGTEGGGFELADIQIELPDEVREEVQQLLEERLARLSERMEQRLQERADLKARLDELRAARGDDASERLTADEIVEIARHFKETKAQLRGEFEADLKAVLGDEQTALWDHAMQLHLRRNALPRGTYAGESLDVSRLLRDAPVESVEDELLEELFADYAVALDAALQGRETHLVASEIARFDAYHAEEYGKFNDLLVSDVEQHVAVRTVNEQFVDALVAMIPDEAEANAVRQAARERSFSRVYRPTRTQRLFKESVRKLELDGETLGTVEELRAQYEAELEPIRMSLIETIREDEPKRAVRMAEMMTRMREGTGELRIPEPSPASAVYADRSRLDAKYAKQLESLVGEEAFKTLPSARQGQFRFGPEGGTRMRAIRRGPSS